MEEVGVDSANLNQNQIPQQSSSRNTGWWNLQELAALELLEVSSEEESKGEGVGTMEVTLRGPIAGGALLPEVQLHVP